MGDDILKQAKTDYGHLTVKELLLLTAYRTTKLEERVNAQNGRIAKLEGWRNYTAGAVAVIVLVIGVLVKALF